MITKEQLISVSFYGDEARPNIFNDYWCFDYEFNIKTQELYHINDGIGEPEFLCKVTDFEKFKQLTNIE